MAGDPLEAAEAALAAMLTELRVQSAVTKVGLPTADDPAAGIDAIAAEVMADLRDELDRTQGELVLSLSRDDAELLWSVVSDDVVELVADHVHEASTIDPERYGPATEHAVDHRGRYGRGARAVALAPVLGRGLAVDATSQSWRVTSDSRIARRCASAAARVMPKNGAAQVGERDLRQVVVARLQAAPLEVMGARVALDRFDHEPCECGEAASHDSPFVAPG